MVDVRRLPRSRRYPRFGCEPLAAALAAAGLRYEHREGLGGMREPDGSATNAGLGVAAFRGYADYMRTERYAAELEGLLALAGARRTAMMCAEAAPARCHRSLIADALTARGIVVEHILGDGGTVRHRLPRTASVESGRVSYPAPQGELWTGAS